MSQRFSEEFLDVFGDWCTYVLNTMEHRDWRVKLVDEVPEGVGSEDAAAEMKFTYGRKMVTMKLCHDFFDFKEEDQEHFWLHEFSHIYIEPIHDLVSNTCVNLGQHAHSILMEWFRKEMEHSVDAISYAIGTMMSHDEEYKRLLRVVFDVSLPKTATES